MTSGKWEFPHGVTDGPGQPASTPAPLLASALGGALFAALDGAWGSAWGLCAGSLLGGALGGLVGVVTSLGQGRWSAAPVVVGLPVALGVPVYTRALGRAMELSLATTLAVAWLLALSLSFAVGAALVRLTRSRRLGRVVRLCLIGGGSLGVLLLSLAPLTRHASGSGVVVAVLVAAAALTLLASSRFRIPALLAAVLSGLVLVRFVPKEHPGLYAALSGPGLAAMVLLAQKAALSHAGHGPSWLWTPTRRFAPGAMLAILALAVLGERTIAARPETEARLGLVSVMARFGQGLTDFDADGEGLFFGRRDCAPFDPKINGNAHEILGNGKDDDCRAGDAPRGVVDRVRGLEAINEAPAPWRADGDIVLVVIDALRFDAVRPDTPGFRRLRKGGYFYERAYAPSSLTVLSLFGLLGGRLPASYPVHFASTFAAWPAAPVDILPLWLGKLGFDTGMAGPPGERGINAFGRDQLGRGFRVSKLGTFETPPEETTDLALGVWRSLSADRPRFLYVHYMWMHVSRPFEAYSSALMDTGRALERLVREIGLDAIWVAVADHGEEFGDHGGRSHARTLYREVVHVPLVIRVPDRPGQAIRSVSPIRSLPATLMALVAPRVLPSGKGPYLCLEQAECRDLPVPMALELPQTHLHGLILGSHHVVRELPRGQLTSFDLSRDPREQRPLADPPRELLEGLQTWEDFALASGVPGQSWPYRVPAFP